LLLPSCHLFPYVGANTLKPVIKPVGSYFLCLVIVIVIVVVVVVVVAVEVGSSTVHALWVAVVVRVGKDVGWVVHLKCYCAY